MIEDRPDVVGRRNERARQAIAGLAGNGVPGSLDGWIWDK